MRFNKKMGAALGNLSPKDFVSDVTLSDDLRVFLNEGFTIFNGAIIFRAMSKNAKSVLPKNFQDLTGFECFINQVHVEDHISNFLPDQNVLLTEGVAFALALQRELQVSFPDKLFTVIVASTGSTCGVRFHMTRTGEEWLATNLDGYEEEAILVLEN